MAESVMHMILILIFCVEASNKFFQRNFNFTSEFDYLPFPDFISYHKNEMVEFYYV